MDIIKRLNSFVDYEINDLLQSQLKSISDDLLKKKQEMIRDAYLREGYNLEEDESLFKKAICIVSNNIETYYYDDGSKAGKIVLIVYPVDSSFCMTDEVGKANFKFDYQEFN